ncbi:MAG: hypothetical protein GF349_02110 [Candidatus Magasanikbacteria bacterium]|nr:hypothetical protein [Candidatus Magasanikbacteria bacterium]
MGRFKKGLFLGGLVGAIMMWLNTTTKGKKVRKQIVENSADVYEKLSDQIMSSESWDKMTKTKYAKMVQEYVDKYAVDNGLADNVKKTIKKLVVSQWGNLKKEAKTKKKS